MEQPLTPREFIHRHSLPQLVRIHNAHLHKLNTQRAPQRPSVSPTRPYGNKHLGSLDSASTSSSSSERHKARRKALTVSKSASKLLEAEVVARDVNILDIDQPFLLYKSYSSRQVTGHTLAPDSSGDTANYSKTGPGLLIPENYPGWFSVVTSKGQTAGYFVTIEEISRAQVPYFLTRDDLSAYAVPRGTNNNDVGNGFGAPFHHLDPYTSSQYHRNHYHRDQHSSHHTKRRSTSSPAVATPSGCYDRTIIPGGTVLRYLGVYEDVSAFILGSVNHLGNGRTSLSSKKNSVRSKSKYYASSLHLQEGQRYAKCIAFSSTFGPINNSSNLGEVVFVPINEIGRFYVIAKKSSPNVSYNHVYSLSHLLRVMSLPATVQLVVGPKPRNYWPELNGLHSGNMKAYFGSYNRRGAKSSNSHRSKSLSEATFTAVLRLEDIRVREVILASTIRPSPFSMSVNPVERSSSSLSSSIRRTLRSGKGFMKGFNSNKEDKETPVLLEFDLDSSFTFVRTFNEKAGTLSSKKIPELVLNRIEYCNNEADNWKRQIKIAHDIIPRTCTLNQSESSNTNTNDSGCSSGNNSNPDEHPTQPSFSHNRLSIPMNQVVKSRPSIFDHPEVFKSSTNLSSKGSLNGHSGINHRMMLMKANSDHNLKNASVTSRSSNISNTSRLSKILGRFWNPMKGKRRDSGNHLNEEDEDANPYDDFMDSDDREPRTLPEREVIKADDENEDGDKEFAESSSFIDSHVYETLKRSDSIQAKINETFHKKSSLSSKSRSSTLNAHSHHKVLSRQSTLDVIFPDVVKIDDDGYILGSSKDLSKSCPGGPNPLGEHEDEGRGRDQDSGGEEFDRLDSFEDIETNHVIPRRVTRPSQPPPPAPRLSLKHKSISSSNMSRYDDNVITSAL